MTPETPDPPPVQCAACRAVGSTAACNLCPTGVHPYRASGAPPVSLRCAQCQQPFDAERKLAGKTLVLRSVVRLRDQRSRQISELATERQHLWRERLELQATIAALRAEVARLDDLLQPTAQAMMASVSLSDERGFIGPALVSGLALLLLALLIERAC